jgi:hypothetical protein
MDKMIQDGWLCRGDHEFINRLWFQPAPEIIKTGYYKGYYDILPSCRVFTTAYFMKTYDIYDEDGNLTILPIPGEKFYVEIEL